MKSLVHLIKCIVHMDSPSSQVTESELQMLLKYSRNAKVVCEIGCFEGKTSVALAKNTVGAVYSVDPFFKGRLHISYGEWIARLHRKRSRAKNLFFLKGFSQDVVRDFRLPIEFLFIDADHSYEAVKGDWNSWRPKMAQGSIYCVARYENCCEFASPTRNDAVLRGGSPDSFRCDRTRFRGFADHLPSWQEYSLRRR
jgi:hypothetical protein